MNSLLDRFRLKDERTWDGLIVIEEIVQEPQAELEQSQVTALAIFGN